MSNWKNFKNLVASGGVCGWLLLAKPLLYLLTARRRDLEMYATVDASAIVSIVFVFVCFIAVLIEANKSYTKMLSYLLTRTPMFWFLLYTIYGFISMFWSVNPQLTGYRAFECFTMMVMMMMVWQKLFAKNDMHLVMNWCILWVIWAVMFEIISTLRWTTNPIDVLSSSQMTATTFFFMFLYYPKKRLLHFLIVVLSLLSGSTVAYIGMGVGAISVFWGRSKYKFLTFIFALFVGLFIANYGFENFVKDTVFHDKESISIEETSGRNHIMETALISLKQNPMGYGFFAGEPYILYQHYQGAINGHNSFFSAAMGLGYVGIVLLSIFFIGMFRVTFYRGIPREYRQPLIGCFFVGFLHCMGNPGIGSRIYGSWMPVMMLFTLICSFYAYNRHLSHQQTIKL